MANCFNEVTRQNIKKSLFIDIISWVKEDIKNELL